MWIPTQSCSGPTWEHGELARLGSDGYMDESSEIASRSFRKKARKVKQLHMVLFIKKTGNNIQQGEIEKNTKKGSLW